MARTGVPLVALSARFWRVLSVRWQRAPVDSGSQRTGGRWNPPGVRALYLSADHSTAIAEYHQDLIRPGTLATYDVTAAKIADLTDPATLAAGGIAPEILSAEWRTIFKIDGDVPPSWPLAEALIRDGAEGAIVPSVQREGGTNLVLWRWHAAGTVGDGAAVTLLDPFGDLA